jgi:hypothetical protein
MSEDEERQRLMIGEDDGAVFRLLDGLALDWGGVADVETL